MPAPSYPKAIGGVCQSTTDYPACRCWTVKCSDSMATNRIWPYKGHAQLGTRQASPQCIWPIELWEARHAIPEITKLSQSSVREKL